MRIMRGSTRSLDLVVLVGMEHECALRQARGLHTLLLLLGSHGFVV